MNATVFSENMKKFRTAKKYTQEQICHILNELTRVDTGAKYGGVTGYTAIELFISKCL